MNTFDARVASASESLKFALTDVLETAETVSIYIKNHQFDSELVKNGDFIAKLTELILSRVPQGCAACGDEATSVTSSVDHSSPTA